MSSSVTETVRGNCTAFLVYIEFLLIIHRNYCTIVTVLASDKMLQCFTITVVPGSHPNTLPVETMLYIMPGDYGMLIRVPGTLLR